MRCLLAGRENAKSTLEQLNVAVFTFQEAMRPILRKQQIKPHWIFALEDLIREEGPYRRLWQIQGALEDEIEADLMHAAEAGGDRE